MRALFSILCVAVILTIYTIASTDAPPAKWTRFVQDGKTVMYTEETGGAGVGLGVVCADHKYAMGILMSDGLPKGDTIRVKYQLDRYEWKSTQLERDMDTLAHFSAILGPWLEEIFKGGKLLLVVDTVQYQFDLRNLTLFKDSVYSTCGVGDAKEPSNGPLSIPPAKSESVETER